MFKLNLIPALCAACAFGQTAPTDVLIQKRVLQISSENSFGPIGITAALMGPLATIPGMPYSAQAVTTRVQTLADGNRITQTTTNNVARDGKGRVRREESLPGLSNSDTPPRLVLIEDPVAGLHYTLDSQSKTAMKLSASQRKKGDEAAALKGMPPPVGSTKIWFSPSGTEQEITVVKKAAEANMAKTDLGTQTVEGVTATGTKLTRTIPAGEMGNDLPIVITTETWFSPELKVIVMSKSTDPRMGETTYKLTGLSRSEPDPALFQVPADYTISDRPVENFVYRVNDK